MAKRETFKDVTIGEKKFRIGKFDAQTGSYIVYQLLSNFLPMIAKNGLPNLDEKADTVLEKITSSLPLMPREQFFQLQKDCLYVCNEIALAGNVETPIPVVLSDGSFCDKEMECDVVITMALMIHALVFNVSGFFGASGLKGIKESFSL